MGGDVAEFIQTFCRLSKGEWAGQPLQVRAFQRDILDDLFELRPDGRRRYRQGLIGLPRKNTKSTFGAGIAVFGLIADGEPGAEVYSCAGDRGQAKIVFGEAKKMVEADEELKALCKLYRDAIEVPGTGSVYRAISSDAALQEGLNPSLVIFDEVHVQPNRELWTVMTQGSSTRRQPLVVGITTAGHDEETLCYELYEYGKKVLSGEIDDPTFFFRWYEPKDPNCDYRDPKVWFEANPALAEGIQKLDDFEATVKSTPESEFRRYRLNQWVPTKVVWLPFGAWDACRNDSLKLDPSLPLYVAIDVGIKHDSSAVAAAQKQGDRTVVRAKVWENPYPPSDPKHAQWKLNIAEIEDYLRSLNDDFRVPAGTVDGRPISGPEFSYDPHFFERSAQDLEGDGLNMVEFPQNDQRMVPVSQTFYDLSVSGAIAHDGDPALKRHVGNVVADARARGYRMSKTKRSKKIDAAIAAAIAIHRAQQPAPVTRQSVYRSRGLDAA